MAIRKKVESLSNAEIEKIQKAFVSLKREINIIDGRSTYDRYILIHQRAMNRLTLGAEDNLAFDRRNSAHRGPAFLPWHREFLTRLERDIQRVAQDDTIGLPYWDWTVDAKGVNHALREGEPLPELSIERLVGPPGTVIPIREQTRYVVTSGPFGFNIGNSDDPDNWWTINDRGHYIFPLERRYAQNWQQFEGQRPTLPTETDVKEVLKISEYDTRPWNEESQSFRNFLEGFTGQGLHNIVHRWVGGSMLPGTSPNDPIFFLHHCNIDRIWAAWQEGKQISQYLPQGGGPCGHNLNDPMYPWDGLETFDIVTPADVWDYKADLNYEYDELPK